MAKRLSETPLTTAKARAKLAPGEYARRLDSESALWYRRGARGGVWFARWRNSGTGAAYKQAAVGPANDENDSATDGLLTFDQAERRARQIVRDARAAMAAERDGPAATVGSAVAEYIAMRDARDTKRAGRPMRSDASRRLSLHVIGTAARGKRAEVAPDPLASVALHSLRETDLRAWRNGLPVDLKATTLQRLVNDLKAALNAGYAARRETLPPEIPRIVKHGLQAMDAGDDRQPVARENQILTDAEVGRILLAAREVDAEGEWGGDLFRLIFTLAVSGARFSQVARLCVRDVQRNPPRLMMPKSRKGRGKSGAIGVPIGDDLLAELASAIKGRPADAFLLERWRHRQTDAMTWVRESRGPWLSASELIRPWAAIRARAKLPMAIPYSLRHSSIVRGLRANLPVRLIAAAHDTSVGMIERHYAAHVVDGLDDLARQALVPLLPKP